MKLPSTKPYLVRAIHQWCCDHSYTPYLAVLADQRAKVPREFVREGRIVLNISYDATGHLKIENDFVSFQARFGGVAREIVVPMSNVLAIYAKENEMGMWFEADAAEPESEKPAEVKRSGLRSVSALPDDNDSDDSEPPEPPATPTGRPKLQRIK